MLETTLEVSLEKGKAILPTHSEAAQAQVDSLEVISMLLTLLSTECYNGFYV
jgi:hypothetical protein